MICCTICILGEINVPTLSVLSIVVVSGAKQFNTGNIVLKGMEFWKVEVCPNPKINEDGFVFMEPPKSSLEVTKGFSCVSWQLGKVQKVQDTADCMEEAYWRAVPRQLHPNDETKKDSTDVTVFLASNTRESDNPFGEVVKVMVWRKSTTPCINLRGTKDGFNPIDNMLDNTLVELVENIWGD